MASDNQRQSRAGLWLLLTLCAVLVTFVVCAGAAYSGIRQAQIAAARAGIGQIEATLYLAERLAEDSGYGPAPAAYANVLRSYGEAGSTLTPQERYVLDTMLNTFGPLRDFDFAVTRTAGAAGIQTQIYFFPVKGKTDTRYDRYYLLSGGHISAANI